MLSGLDTFPNSALKVHRPVVGEYQQLVCHPPVSYPPAQIYWGEAAPVGSKEKLKAIEETDRIILDYEGKH